MSRPLFQESCIVVSNDEDAAGKWFIVSESTASRGEEGDRADRTDSVLRIGA